MSTLLYGWYIDDSGAYGALTQEEKEHNAYLAMSALRQNGFTIYAAAGVVGNMWAESQMNPAQWEDGTPYSGGYGLVQWTPWSDYWPWPADSTDWLNNGPRQMERLIYERDNNLEFGHHPEITGWNWTRYCNIAPGPGVPANDAVNMAAEIFLYKYLSPSDPAGSLANRQYHARYVYQHCPGSALPPWLLLWWNNKNRKVIK